MVGAFVANFMGCELKDDAVYQEKMAKGQIQLKKSKQVAATASAKLSVYIFAIAITVVVIYATLISDSIGVITNPHIDRNQAIMAIMLSAAAAMVTFVSWIPTKSQRRQPSVLV